MGKAPEGMDKVWWIGDEMKKRGFNLGDVRLN